MHPTTSFMVPEQPAAFSAALASLPDPHRPEADAAQSVIQSANQNRPPDGDRFDFELRPKLLLLAFVDVFLEFLANLEADGREGRDLHGLTGSEDCDRYGRRGCAC